METVIRKGWNPDTEQEYEVELPANDVVEKALLEIDYPLGGLRREEVADILAEEFSLTDEQRNAKNKVGQRLFNFYLGIMIPGLVKSGKVVEPKYGWIHIYPDQVIEQGKTLKNDFDNSDGTPEKSIEGNYQQIRRELAIELLQKIKDNTPTFFEELVVDLLVKMGYGGSREDAEAVGRGGDGGIDGIINEDRLGLDVIYVQAKRWEGNVSRPEIQKFAGALQGQRARKGVFITTSNFTREATGYVDTIDSKIVLIDGNQLAQLMIDHDVGVSVEKTYEIKRVDSDYFAENTE